VKKVYARFSRSLRSVNKKIISEVNGNIKKNGLEFALISFAEISLAGE
jgi:hypothetical protein